ncbi:MAG: glycosyltransferase family 4 protein [Chloroflexi bacterium]|nr:glycosyltransferase family 4 protein [Chloroflexota bacterium]
MTQPLRVLHCRQGDRVWGPERQILQLAERLPDYGIEMEIVLLRRWGLDPKPHPLAARARRLGCEVLEVPARPQDWRQVVRLLRSRLRDCGILHTHEFKSDLLGYWAARQSNRPWIATDHHLAIEDDWLLRLFGYADRVVLKRAQAVVVPSYSQAERLSRHVPLERIHVIYHGIDAQAFARSAGNERAALRRRYGVADDEHVIAIFGRLEPVKGHRDFLRAARRMLERRDDLRFWVVGEGSLEPVLRRQVQELGIAHRVDFLGYQNDVAPLMAASDLVLMPSRHESFGIVLIEAMSLGKPVIASAAGGIPEVVLDGASGYLVPPGDPDQLSRRVLEMLSNPGHAQQIGLAGRERVHREFTVEQMVEQMAALYHQVDAVKRGAFVSPRPQRAPLSAV